MEYNPFCKEINIKKLFKTEDFNEAQKRLEFLQNTKGIGLFTGNPGCGKTYAVKYYLENLNKGLHKIIYLPLSTISILDFYESLAISLGLETYRSKAKMFFNIQSQIKNLVNDQKKNLIIAIDEAQLLREDILTDLKMIFNFNMDSSNMVTLILIGLPAINHTLSKKIYEDLSQRIVMKYDFIGINEKDIRLYIEDRLKLVKAKSSIFEENSYVAIANSCDGSLRKLNLIIERALTIGALEKAEMISTEIVMKAVSDIAIA